MMENQPKYTMERLCEHALNLTSLGAFFVLAMRWTPRATACGKRGFRAAIFQIARPQPPCVRR